MPTTPKQSSGNFGAPSGGQVASLCTKQARGNFGEDIAAAHLAQHGYAIIARNFRTRLGEIDLIAQNEHCLVFVEVKLRKVGARVGGAESVTPAKQRKLHAAAEAYLQHHAVHLPSRFDVIAIETAPNGQVAAIQWIEHAF
ncbi:MAG: YraN family protein [Oscillospiraceae bacterium]|nr:YraN family protein [Oscillospiraceae bacterium]